MSRTTHDINLDHHGTLEWDSVSASSGVGFGQYYPTDPLDSILSSLDERLTAIANGYNIVAGRFDLDSWLILVVAVDMPSDAYFDPTVPGTKERTFLTAEAEIE